MDLLLLPFLSFPFLSSPLLNNKVQCWALCDIVSDLLTRPFSLFFFFLLCVSQVAKFSCVISVVTRNYRHSSTTPITTFTTRNTDNSNDQSTSYRYVVVLNFSLFFFFYCFKNKFSTTRQHAQRTKRYFTISSFLLLLLPSVHRPLIDVRVCSTCIMK